MTSRNPQGPHFFYRRLRHWIRLTLTPVLLPRLILSAVFFYPAAYQRT